MGGRNLEDVARVDATVPAREPYECRTCGQRYELEYYVCPECEGFSVERV